MGDPPSEEIMSDNKSKPAASKTGRGSPAGPRWFVSKSPALTLEVVPQQYPDEHGNRKPFLRVTFKSEIKSPIHIGDRRLGSDNPMGNDLNAPRHYGLFFVMDPGPLPKDGYKDDDEAPLDSFGKPREDWMRTADQKSEDRRIVDHFRKTHLYRSSPQDNQYRVTAKLTELDWDPVEIRIAVAEMVIPGVGRPMPRPNLSGAPEDAVATAVSSAKTGPAMGTKNRSIARKEKYAREDHESLRF